jgi:Na+-driven multidrug efflux pump
MLGSVANTLFAAATALFLIPRYVQTAGPRLFGAWSSSGDLLSWLQYFDFGLTNLLLIKIAAAHGMGNERQIGRILASGALLTAIGSMLVVALGVAISFPLATWMRVEGAEAEQLRNVFLIATGASALALFNFVFVSFGQGVQRTGYMTFMATFSLVVSFLVSFYLVNRGFQLYAIAYGLLARSLVLFAGGVAFIIFCRLKGVLGPLKLDKLHLREMLHLSPFTMVGGLAYAAMTTMETVLVTMLLSPTLTTVYVLTRRGADLCRGLADMVGFASQAGFAHLLASDARKRALQVFAEINSVRSAVAFSLAAAYIAANPSLCAVWVGPQFFGGIALTALMGIQMVVGGGAFMVNYLYRSTGQIRCGSLLLVAEAVIRIGFAAGLLLWLGLVGIPLAAIITASASSWITFRLLKRQVPDAEPQSPLVWRVLIPQIVLIGLAVLVASQVQVASWLVVIGIGTGFLITGILISIGLDRNVRSTATLLLKKFRRVENGTG